MSEGARKGFRDLYWCHFTNEPALVYGDGECPECEDDVVDTETSHTFVAHIKKPGQGAVDISIPADPLADTRAAARLLEEACNNVHGDRHLGRLMFEAVEAARAASRELEKSWAAVGQRKGSDSE